jgi:hypothetical protein
MAFYTVADCLLSESTALSRVTLQWEAPPRHHGGEGWRADLSDTVAAAALVTSPLVGEGAACIVQIRHNIYIYIYIYICVCVCVCVCVYVYIYIYITKVRSHVFGNPLLRKRLVSSVVTICRCGNSTIPL